MRSHTFNIMTKWSGGTHDAFIWANSALTRLFNTGTTAEALLLSDCGHSLRLLTPVIIRTQHDI